MEKLHLAFAMCILVGVCCAVCVLRARRAKESIVEGDVVKFKNAKSSFTMVLVDNEGGGNCAIKSLQVAALTSPNHDDECWRSINQKTSAQIRAQLAEKANEFKKCGAYAYKDNAEFDGIGNDGTYVNDAGLALMSYVYGVQFLIYSVNKTPQSALESNAWTPVHVLRDASEDCTLSTSVNTKAPTVFLYNEASSNADNSEHFMAMLPLDPVEDTCNSILQGFETGPPTLQQNMEIRSIEHKHSHKKHGRWLLVTLMDGTNALIPQGEVDDVQMDLSTLPLKKWDRRATTLMKQYHTR